MEEMQKIFEICGKPAKIETGWPHSGISNGRHIASKENQMFFLQNLLKKTHGDVTVMSLFD